MCAVYIFNKLRHYCYSGVMETVIINEADNVQSLMIIYLMEEKALVANMMIYGNIITMNEQNSRAQAMSIREGRIEFVGSKADAQAFLDVDTKVIDFGSKVIYPGMIDAHNHMGLLSTVIAGGPRFAYGDSYEKNVQELTEYIKENPGKEMYKAYGYSPDPLVGDPTHDLLDAIEIDGKKFDKPIIVTEVSGHASWLNKAAMEKFGVNREMVEKYGEDVVTCDSDGEPLGCIKETPHYAVLGSIPVDLEEAKEMFVEISEDHLKHGYTMIGDCGIDEGANPMVTAMGELAREGRFRLKVRAYYQIFESSAEPLKEVDRAIEYAKKYNCDSFKIIGIKIFLDGVNAGLSAWSLKPYVGYKFKGKPYSGYKRWDYDRIEELAKIIRKANENGLSVELHAIGSGAARYALDVIEKAQAGIEHPDFRNAVSHLYCVDKDDIPRFGKMNAIPVVAPQWYVFVPAEIEGEKMIYGDPEKDKNLEGQGYLDIGPMQSYIDTGAICAFHSDGAGDDVPSRLFFNAVNKYDPIMDPNMKPRNYKEHMNAYDAVKCMTVNSAYVLKEEDNLGTLEKGKQADFVVYEVDFTDEDVITNPMVCGILPKAMYINGEKIY